MFDSKNEYAWNHTAGLMAIVANTVRDSKKRPRPYGPEDFHPVLIKKRRDKIRSNPVPITVLRDIFVNRKMPEVN